MTITSSKEDPPSKLPQGQTKCGLYEVTVTFSLALTIIAMRKGRTVISSQSCCENKKWTAKQFAKNAI